MLEGKGQNNQVGFLGFQCRTTNMNENSVMSAIFGELPYIKHTNPSYFSKFSRNALCTFGVVVG